MEVKINISYLSVSMKRLVPLVIILLAIGTGCGSSDRTVEVRKPRLHKTWPKTHRWHKRLKIWKFKIQMPERGGTKKVRMRN
jgi:hypothetical protein